MLFLGKKNIFKCLVAFQKMFWKIFSSVWLCSWKYHRKHIFYLLLTFSHIFSIAKQIYNIIPQYRNTKETKFRKKIHQIRSNWEKKEEREATGFDLEARSYGGCEGEIARQRWDQAALESIFAWLAQCYDRRDRWSVGRWTRVRSEECAVVVVGLELGLRTGLSLLPLSPLSVFARESGNGLNWKFSL